MNKKAQMQAQPGMTKPGAQPVAGAGVGGQPAEKKSKLWLWLLIVLIVLIGAAIGTWFWLG
jgi:hypothetical protein